MAIASSPLSYGGWKDSHTVLNCTGDRQLIDEQILVVSA